jgi:hypothetical protein
MLEEREQMATAEYEDFTAYQDYQGGSLLAFASNHAKTDQQKDSSVHKSVIHSTISSNEL